MPPPFLSICSFPSTGKPVFETSRTKPKASFLSHLTKNPTLSLKKQVCATSSTLEDEMSSEITTINHQDRKNGSKKRILEAYQLFEKMTNQRHIPTPSTCNTLVFALCDHRMFRKAVQIVEFMLRSGMLLDEVCTLIIKNLTTIGAYEYAIQLLDVMEQRGCTLHQEVYDKLTKSLCRKADTLNPGRGWHCLDKLIQKGLAPTDPDTINRLINAAYVLGGTYLTVSVLTQILLRGGEPDFRCYNRVLAAYKEDNMVNEALEVFLVLPPCLKYHLKTYNLLLHALSGQGRWSEAEALLDDMMERGFMPDIVTHKGLILAIANKGYTQEALEIVEQLGINGLEIDTWCFNPIIMQFCSEGQVNMVYKCLKNMERWNCPFNFGTYRAIALLCSRGMLDEAVKILESLRQKQGKELSFFYGKELFGYLCCRGNTFEALQILTKLEQVQYTPKLHTFLYFVNGLCMECFHEEAVEMFEVMDKYNVRLNIEYYNKLVFELCKAGRIDLAIMALEKMAMKGHEPTESTYVIIIEAFGNLERKDLVGELLRELYARGELSQESMEKISLKFCLDNVGF